MVFWYGDVSVGGGVLKDGGVLELGVVLVSGGILQCPCVVKGGVSYVTFVSNWLSTICQH